MIRLPHIILPHAALRNLAAYQRRVDSEPNYPARVRKGKALFQALNKETNSTFHIVRLRLELLCSGARRCCYCEDSAAVEVEHIKPKDLYPDLAFVWENYLYACGPCNRPKNNRFRIFNRATGHSTDVTRRRGAPVVPPVNGDPVLIDPRTEDPLDYLELDIQDTFFFTPRSGLSARDVERAEYTRDVLQLNDREYLPQSRRDAYGSYRARLVEYENTRHVFGNRSNKVRNLVRDLRNTAHPTVWREMQRQHRLVPELRTLFRANPEALTW